MPRGVYTRTKEYREKQRLAHKGKLNSGHFKKGRSTWNKGRKIQTNTGRTHLKKGHSMPLEIRKKISEALKGDKSPLWMGGIGKNPYPFGFNKVLKLKIRTRDSFICCLCGRTEREELEELNRALSVNHIDFNKNNCKESNLNTLCLRCNVKINRERDYWTNYFQDTEL